MTIRGNCVKDLPEREIEGFQFIPSRDRCLGKYERISLNQGRYSGTRYAVFWYAVRGTGYSYNGQVLMTSVALSVGIRVRYAV